MTLVNRLDGFQSIIESAKAQVSGSANTQLVEELSQVGTFLKDIAALTDALQVQGNITQSNPDILALTTLLTGNIARVLKPALEAQAVQVQPAAVAQAVNPDLQAQFDAGIQEGRAAQTSEDTLTADIQSQIEAQRAQAAQPAPQATPYVATPYPAGLVSEAEVQAYQQSHVAQPQQIVVAGTPAPVGGQDLTAQFRPQITQPAPVAPVQPTAPAHPVTQTVQAEDPLTASIRAQVNGQPTQAVQAHVVPAATQTQAATPAQNAMQQLFDAKLNEVRSGQ